MIPHWKQKFVTLWVGQALSILTSMVSQYALIWYLTDQTGSSAVLSAATIAALLPQGILSLFTGAFADRFDRRFLMAAADGAHRPAVPGTGAGGRRRAPDPRPHYSGAGPAQRRRRVSRACIQAVTPLIAPPDALTAAPVGARASRRSLCCSPLLWPPRCMPLCRSIGSF